MKKTVFIAILLSLVMLLSSCTIKITGNGYNQSSSEEEIQISDVEMQINTQYTLDKLIYFKLIKVSNTPLIYDTMGSGSGYEPFSSSQSYIDLIFEISNNSLEQYNCKESMKIVPYFYEYGEVSEQSGEFVAENDGWSLLSSYSKAYVESGETNRVHFFVSVSNDDLNQVFTFTLSTSDATYTLKYNPAHGTLGDITEIQTGVPITIQNYANITLEGVSYSNLILPSNTRGNYTYYENSDSSNTFLIFKFTVESLLNEAADYDQWINAFAFYDDDDANTYYQSVSVIEDKNMRDLYMEGEINPEETRTLYVVFNVPSSLSTKACNIDFISNGDFLSYTILPVQVNSDNDVATL